MVFLLSAWCTMATNASRSSSVLPRKKRANLQQTTQGCMLIKGSFSFHCWLLGQSTREFLSSSCRSTDYAVDKVTDKVWMALFPPFLDLAFLQSTVKCELILSLLLICLTGAENYIQVVIFHLFTLTGSGGTASSCVFINIQRLHCHKIGDCVHVKVDFFLIFQDREGKNCREEVSVTLTQSVVVHVTQGQACIRLCVFPRQISSFRWD